MEKKIIGIFVMMLLIATVLPVTGSIEKSSYMTEKNEPFVFIDLKTGEEIQYIMMETDIESKPPKEQLVRTQDNLAPNPSFEEGDVLPTGWEHTDFGQGEEYYWDSDYAYSGEKSIGISVPAQQNWYEWYTTDFIPIDTKNNYYEFSCYYKYTDVPDIAWQQVLFIGFDLYDINENRITGLSSTFQYHDTLDWCFDCHHFHSRDPSVGSNQDNYPLMDPWSGNGDNQPPNTPTINGPTNGKVETTYEYTFSATDVDEDKVYYYIEWGDNAVEE